MKVLTVIIPLRQGGYPETTMRSLSKQTFQDFDVIVSQDEKGNASWARNRGFELAKTEFVLFCDDDINWMADGLETLVTGIRNHPAASYSYGSYWMDGRLYCDQEFDPVILRHRNYISTMSVIRTADFPMFDESLDRLQDWELWVRMMLGGKAGVYCGRLIFKTERRDGITRNGRVSYEEAEQIVKEKHGL